VRPSAKAQDIEQLVLQAATRCLRQVPEYGQGPCPSLIDNHNILDRQFRDLRRNHRPDLNHAGQETRRSRIVLRKLDLPPLLVTQIVRTITKKEGAVKPLRLEHPKNGPSEQLLKRVYTIAEQESTYSVLRQVSESVAIETEHDGMDCYAAAVELSGLYRLDVWQVYDELKRLYGSDDIPTRHLGDLGRQIEEQTRFYEVKEEKVDVALALVKPDGFQLVRDASGAELYTAEIVYPKDREKLLLSWEATKKENPGDFGFHYAPYNFDSNPEKNFFEQMLVQLNMTRGEVEDVYFTGAVTDPAKTDFYVEYKDDKGKMRRYTPDFVIRRKPKQGGKPGSGRVVIVEIKREHDRAHPVDGETGRKAMALRKWEKLNPDRLKYQMIFTSTDTVSADQVGEVKRFVEEP
jgi:hypothetical protein